MSSYWTPAHHTVEFEDAENPARSLADGSDPDEVFSNMTLLTRNRRRGRWRNAERRAARTPGPTFAGVDITADTDLVVDGLLIDFKSTDSRAPQWVPAFEWEWAAELGESRRTFSLAALYKVLEEWQGLIASAPAVDAFVASGYDDSRFIDTAALRGRRR
ncbi:DUF6247 family protein [Streptomyces sp. NPDC091265]|uniref:DUF6247 family protein n=1 Tax=unclassified Streptomyces TaxID=2593676 RepID=UPI00344FAE97